MGKEEENAYIPYIERCWWCAGVKKKGVGADTVSMSEANPLRLGAAQHARVCAIEAMLCDGSTRARIQQWVAAESGWRPLPSVRSVDRLIAQAHRQMQARPRVQRDAARTEIEEKLRALHGRAVADRQHGAALGALRELAEIAGLHAPPERTPGAPDDGLVVFRPTGEPLPGEARAEGASGNTADA